MGALSRFVGGADHLDMTPAHLQEPMSMSTRGAIGIVRQLLDDDDAEGGYLVAAQQQAGNVPLVMLTLASMYCDVAQELAGNSGEPAARVLERTVEKFIAAEQEVGLGATG